MLEKIVFLFLVLNIGCSVFADDLKNENMERDARDPPGIMWFGPRVGKRARPAADVDEAQAMEKMMEAAELLKAYYDQLNIVVHAPEEDTGKQVMKKLFFTPKLGRSLDDERALEVDFTPRLGRRTLENNAPDVENMMEAADLLKFFYDQPNIVVQEGLGKQEIKKLFFTPKLGRSLDEKRAIKVVFIPRPGRTLDNNANPPKIAEGRSKPHYLVSLFTPRPGRSLLYDLPEKVRVARSAEHVKENKTKSS